jgi:hypothetical protein
MDANDSPLEGQPQDDPLHGVTHERFASAIGSEFTVLHPQGDFAIVLSGIVTPAVDEYHLETRRQRGIRLTPFNLHFRGPREPRLAQGMVALSHPDFALFELFLVPVGVDAEGAIYEAVFN